MALIDNAARALAMSVRGSDDWDVLDAAMQAEMKKHVCSVLAVLRHPDKRMTESGAEVIRHVRREEADSAHQSDAANTWRFMMDALLA